MDEPRKPQRRRPLPTIPPTAFRFSPGHDPQEVRLPSPYGMLTLCQRMLLVDVVSKETHPRDRASASRALADCERMKREIKGQPLQPTARDMRPENIAKQLGAGKSGRQRPTPFDYVEAQVLESPTPTPTPEPQAPADPAPADTPTEGIPFSPDPPSPQSLPPGRV